jgi:hypothetical protein
MVLFVIYEGAAMASHRTDPEKVLFVIYEGAAMAFPISCHRAFAPHPSALHLCLHPSAWHQRLLRPFTLESGRMIPSSTTLTSASYLVPWVAPSFVKVHGPAWCRLKIQKVGK